jgi:hypothetical protein
MTDATIADMITWCGIRYFLIMHGYTPNEDLRTLGIDEIVVLTDEEVKAKTPLTAKTSAELLKDIADKE